MAPNHNFQGLYKIENSGKLSRKILDKERDKAKLIYLLLRFHGSLDEIVSNFDQNIGSIYSLVEENNLNLENYVRLTSKVQQYGEEINDRNPYVLNDKRSDCIKESLNENGWRRHCLKGMEIWEKGKTYTTMTARVVLDHNSDYFTFVMLDLYGKDGRIIKGFGLDNIFNKDIGYMSKNAQIQRERLVFGTAESYLSGETNRKEILELFRNNRIDDSVDKDTSGGIVKLREYLSGGIISPEEFQGSLEMVKNHKIDRDWLVKLRSGYIESKPEEFRGKNFLEYMNNILDR